MLRLLFYYDGQQVWFWQDNNFTLWSKIKLCFLIIICSQDRPVNFYVPEDATGTRMERGREYKL